MAQWTKTCHQIFNIDYQYMLCYWLNKLLYSCKHNGMAPIKTKCFRCYSYFNHPFIDINTIFYTFIHRKCICIYNNWRAWSTVNVNLLKPTDYVKHRQDWSFNNCMLCPHCIYVFCIYLRTNSDLCHLQHKLIGFYNRDEKCLLRGTDWVFI